MANWITPVDVTPASSPGWVDVDCSGSIPSGATGVILHINNLTWSYSGIGWRKNGSTDNRLGAVYDGHTWAAVGVDDDRICELNVYDHTTVTVWLVGYFTNDAVFFVNGHDESLSSATTWTDIDISGDTGDDTAIGAIFENQATGTYGMGLRKNGSTDARTENVTRKSGWIIGLDGSEICEGYVSSTSEDFWLLGYITGYSTFNTNATDISITASSWKDAVTLPAGGIGGYIEVTKSESTRRTYGLRVNGSSENISDYVAGNHNFGIVEADGSRIIEGIINASTVDFFLVGYAELTPIVILPSTEALNLTLPEPTIDTGVINETVEPSAETLTLTQQTPNINYDYALGVSTQSLTLTSPTPTVAYDYTLDVATQTLTLTAPSPTISVGPVISPNALSLSLTSSVPTPVWSSSVSPLTQAIALTLQSSTIDASAIFEPSSLDLSLTSQTPTTIWSSNIIPSAQTLALTSPAPNPIWSGRVSPSVTTLSLTQENPTIAYDFKHTVSAIGLTTSLKDQTIKWGGSVSPSAVALTLSQETPTILYDFAFSVSALDLTSTLYAPTILLGELIIYPTALALSIGYPLPYVIPAGIYTNAYVKFKSILEDVQDPDNKAKFVYGSYPILGIDNRDDYPLIILKPVGLSQDAISFKSLKEGSLETTIDVFATNKTELDSVSDDLIKTIYDADASFTSNGIMNMKLVSNIYDTFPRENLRVHSRSLYYQFDYYWI